MSDTRMDRCGEHLARLCCQFQHVALRYTLRDFQYIMNLLSHAVERLDAQERVAVVGIPCGVLSRLVCFDTAQALMHHTEQHKDIHGSHWKWNWILFINSPGAAIYSILGVNIVDVATHACHLPPGFKHIIPRVPKGAPPVEEVYLFPEETLLPTGRDDDPENAIMLEDATNKKREHWSQYLSKECAAASEELDFTQDAWDTVNIDLDEDADFAEAPWLLTNNDDLLRDDTWALPDDSPKVFRYDTWVLPIKHEDTAPKLDSVDVPAVQTIEDPPPPWNLVEGPLLFSHEQRTAAHLTDENQRALFYGVWAGALDQDIVGATTKTTMIIQECEKVAKFGERIAVLTSCQGLALELCRRLGWLDSDQVLRTNPMNDAWQLVVLQTSLFAPFILSRATHVIVADGFVTSKLIVDLHDSLHCRVTYVRISGTDPFWESPALLHWFPALPSRSTLFLLCEARACDATVMVDLRMVSLAVLQGSTELRLDRDNASSSFFVHQGLMHSLSSLCAPWWHAVSNLLVDRTKFDRFAQFSALSLATVDGPSLSCAKTFWLAKLILDNLGHRVLHVFVHANLYVFYHAPDMGEKHAPFPSDGSPAVLGYLYTSDVVAPHYTMQEALQALYSSFKERSSLQSEPVDAMDERPDLSWGGTDEPDSFLSLSTSLSGMCGA